MLRIVDVIFIAEVATKMMSSCALVEGLGTRLNVSYFVKKIHAVFDVKRSCISTKPTFHVKWIEVLLGVCLRKEGR